MVGLLAGKNIITITQWMRSTLKPFYYVTPLYFIKTEYDIISFRPIWSLNDVSVTHNYKNGFYQNSDITLKFDGHVELITISSKEKVDKMFYHMRTYDNRIRSEFSRNNIAYFRVNDDFLGVQRRIYPSDPLLSKRERTYIYVLSVLLCSAVLYGTVSINDSQVQWIRHSNSGTPPKAQQLSQSAVPEQPLPQSGNSYSYTRAERVAPFEIKAAQGQHYLVKLVNAYNKSPVMLIFVRSGSTVNVDVPLGTYEVRYASGEKWYGYEYLFGPETACSKADRTFAFEVENGQYTGFTITLYTVPHGNLSTSTIRPTDF